VRGRSGALREEIDYWEGWLATRGGRYADSFAYHFDPESEVADSALRAVLAGLEEAGDTLSILDVGAGPASTVGQRFRGKQVAVTAVDPLAEGYRRLLLEYGLEPPVPTERLDGERLEERFGSGRFDVAYARNALDHAVDPIAIVESMLKVVRNGGYVVLRHVRNEAVRQQYTQLHQWNFDERAGAPVVWRPGTEIGIPERLAATTFSCHTEANDTWVIVVIAKLQRFPVDVLQGLREPWPEAFEFSAQMALKP
jgi:SAM-dependent methyltransferase